jgi:hypothetical protein
MGCVMEGVLGLVIGMCLLAGLVLAWWLMRPPAPEGGLPAVPAAAARQTARWRRGGVITGLAVGGVAAGAGALGRGLLLAAPLFGLCVLAGVVAGEVSVRPAAGRTRAAVLELRRVRDYLPRGLTRATAAATAVLAGLIAVTSAVAAPDGLGRAGRDLQLACGSGLLQTSGPWPGSFYTVPLAVLVAAGLVLAGGALRAVAGRARTGTDQESVAADDALRRRAAWTVTSACGILVAVPLAGLCAVSAGAVLSLFCRPAWLTVAGWALLGLAIAAVGLLSWCAAVLLAPGRVVTARPAR